jgi:hypothetical protein
MLTQDLSARTLCRDERRRIATVRDGARRSRARATVCATGEAVLVLTVFTWGALALRHEFQRRSRRDAALFNDRSINGELCLCLDAALQSIAWSCGSGVSCRAKPRGPLRSGRCSLSSLPFSPDWLAGFGDLERRPQPASNAPDRRYWKTALDQRFTTPRSHGQAAPQTLSKRRR